MTALSRLLNLQQLSTNNREAQELAAATAVDGNTSGVVTSTDNNGNPVLRTVNGGTLTANSSGFIIDGETVQASTSSGGIAQVGAIATEPLPAPGTTETARIRYRLVDPVPGQDFGNPGDLWINEGLTPIVNALPRTKVWRWSPLNGQFVLVSGNDRLEFGGFIPGAGIGTYPVRQYVTIPARIIALHGSAGVTAQLNPAIGTVLTVGDTLNLEITATDGSDYSFTVELQEA